MTIITKINEQGRRPLGGGVLALLANRLLAGRKLAMAYAKD